jgi:hypothetical protein
MRKLAWMVVLAAGTALAQAPEAPRADYANLPDAEKARRSQEALARMRLVLKEALDKLGQARRTRDMVQLGCVNEKLTHIKGLLRVSEEADAELAQARGRGERSQMEQEFAKVMMARHKVDQLRAETQECVGQVAFRTDENMVLEVEVPDNLPEDPTRPPAPAPIVTRPPPASPTR